MIREDFVRIVLVGKYILAPQSKTLVKTNCYRFAKRVVSVRRLALR
jgi:hypothetical protein